MYIKLNASKHEKIMGGFWLNDGSLTEDTVFNQFVHVVSSFESIDCRVIVLFQDSGGKNASFVVRLRNRKVIEKAV